MKLQGALQDGLSLPGGNTADPGADKAQHKEDSREGQWIPLIIALFFVMRQQKRAPPPLSKKQYFTRLEIIRFGAPFGVLLTECIILQIFITSSIPVSSGLWCKYCRDCKCRVVTFYGIRNAYFFDRHCKKSNSCKTTVAPVLAGLIWV